MYERILVPLDGSDLAEQVIPHVEALARKFDSVVTLISATQTPRVFLTTGAAPAGVPVAVPVLNPEPLIEGEKQAVSGYLDAVADRMRAQGVSVEYEQVEGDPAEVIVERARQLHVGLIAMTTHGRGGLRRLFYGSVAEAVLRKAPCPVLLVRVSEDVVS